MYSNLKGTFLEKTDFSGARLHNTDLGGAYLKEAKLTGARLKGAKLEGSYSGVLSASGVYYLKKRIGELADLKGCKFGDGKLTDLRDVSCGVLTEGFIRRDNERSKYW